MRGAVQRVTFMDQVVCLDGRLLPVPPLGKDMSSHLKVPPPPMSPVISPTVQSMTAPESPQGKRATLSATSKATSKLRQAETGAILPLLAATGSSSTVIDDLGLPVPIKPALSTSLQSLLAQPNSFKNSHVLSVKQYTRSDLHLLFTVAQEMRLGVQREGVMTVLRGRVLCTLFYEPSTRTSSSFDAAMQRLGGRTIPIATSSSSVQKGETLQDTLRTLACYGDAIVLRHPDEASVDVARRFSPVPVINGGNGSKEHPTQAFLDLFTIREELGTLTGKTVTFLGDLLYGRPVHSLVYLFQHYDVKVQLVCPKSLALPGPVHDQLVRANQLLCESETLTREILGRTDVLYCTRVQKERFPSLADYDKVKNLYRIDNGTLRDAKATMVVMHPLPRNDEVAEEVDFDQRAAYFRQVST